MTTNQQEESGGGSSTNLLSELEKRIEALESGAQFEATKAAVQQVEEEFLIKLRDIRTAILAEQERSAASSVLKSELETLRAENEELKKKNAKLEYRVGHVVASMEMLFKRERDMAKGRAEI